MKRRFEDALQDCLAALATGRATIDDCLALLRAWKLQGVWGKVEIAFSAGRIVLIKPAPTIVSPSAVRAHTPTQPHGPPCADGPEPLDRDEEPLPRTTAYRLRGCPRCGGDLLWEDDRYVPDREPGAYACVQCGATA
jgi:hypothetical protein